MHLHLTQLQSQRILLEAGPSVASFRYANYDVDPRPRVLVMGKYSPPTTGTNLIAGVNLNYLSHKQIARLAELSDKIFGDGSLKIRYRRLAKVLPDIAQYYRTYNSEHINMISVDDFLSEPTAAKPKRAQKSDLKQPKKTEKSKRPEKPRQESPKPTPKPKTQLPEPESDPDRTKWQTKRRLYQPQTKRRTTPERHREDDLTRLAKNARYRQQQRREKRELAKPEPNEISIDDLNDIADDFDEVKEDRYGGVVAFKPYQYILTHSPGMYDGSDNPKAVQNIRTGQIVVDSASDHVEMITDAGWQYPDVVRYEAIDGSLRVLYDCDDNTAKRCIDRFLADKACGILLINSKIIT